MTDTTKPSVTESFELLTGFDELAIEKAFSCASVDDLQPMRRLRALVFVARRREGSNDAEAYAYAMGLSTKETGDHFADEAEGDDPADAEFGAVLSPVGNGDTNDA